MTASALLDRYYAEGHWHAEPLWESFRGAARAGAEVVDGERRESLPDFLERASRIAAGFAAAGLVPGDTILVQSRNRADAFAALLACFAAGYVAAPLPPIFSVRQVAAVARGTRARGYLLFDGDAAARPRDVTTEGGPDPVVFAPDEAPAAGARPWSDCLAAEPRDWPGVSPDVPAFVMHSSGSMGDPKGVVHSGNSLRFSMRAVAKRHRVTADDRVLVPCEFGFVGGTVLGGLLGLLAGTSVVLMRKWDAPSALELITAERITYSLLMPTHCHDVLRCSALDSADTSSLSRAIMAGITHADRRDAMRRFTPAPLSMFGMSESIGHSTPSPDDPEAALLDTDGRTLGGAETLIVDPDGRPLPAGTPGELLVRGPNRLIGYLGRPDLTSEAISPDGWFRTGDRAVVDAHGFFTFIGREKDIIRRGGVTILPSDIENVLRQHLDIEDIAVVSVPDERLGEKACACIVPRAGANPDRDSLAAYLQAQDVARYLWPEHVLLFDTLPRTASLKVRRADLRTVAIQRLVRPAG